MVGGMPILQLREEWLFWSMVRGHTYHEKVVELCEISFFSSNFLPADCDGEVWLLVAGFWANNIWK